MCRQHLRVWFKGGRNHGNLGDMVELLKGGAIKTLLHIDKNGSEEGEKWMNSKKKEEKGVGKPLSRQRSWLMAIRRQ